MEKRKSKIEETLLTVADCPTVYPDFNSIILLAHINFRISSFFLCEISSPIDVEMVHRDPAQADLQKYLRLDRGMCVQNSLVHEVPQHEPVLRADGTERNGASSYQ